MWVSLVLVLLVGATATQIPTQTENQTAWEPGYEYKYVVRSYTITTLGEHNNPINDQISGVVINALLTIQVTSPDTLIGNLAKAQYAQVHKELPQDLELFPDNKLNFESLPLKGKNFVIILKRGIIQELRVDSETSVWELNLLKSIATQLQLDTLGENAVKRPDTQLPSDKSPFGLYNVLEQSVGGNCEVQYNVMPLSKPDEFDPNLIPIQRLAQGTKSFDIRKTKNYQNCRDPKVLSVNIDSNTRIVTRMSTSRSIISGSLKKYTIQAYVAKSSIAISLDENSALGTINTISKMTLRAKREIRQPLQENPASMIPVNDLTYSYEYSLDQMKLEDPSRKSVASSKELLENTKDILLDTRSSEEIYQNPHYRSVFNKQLSTSLDDLPESPLIYDVGYTTLQLTTEQRINKIRALIEVVIKDLRTNKNLSVAPSEYLLVVKLMRTLKLKSLNELKLLLEQDDNSLVASEDVKYPLKDVKYPKLTAVKVFYKALAELGTGPALLLIKQYIKENELRGEEAARAIKRLDTAARFVTVEYIEAVCDMLVDPIMTKEKAINQTVSQVCGKLLRKADKSFTKFINNRDLKNLISRYIDIMDQKLMQVLKDNDVAQAYAIVLGLGYTADPKIISVFEPYLEGTYVEGSKMLVKRIYDYELAKDLKFQHVNRSEFNKKKYDYTETEAIEMNVPKQLRKMMVMMLDDVIRRNPSSTRSVVHKIFLNQRESLELRCVAVNSYIMSNPSTLGLMQVINHVNIESNKELRSCVRNSLINAAKDQPLLRANLETKARIVLKYLEPSSIQNIWDIAIDWIISVIEQVVSDVIGNSYYNKPSSMPFRAQTYRLSTTIENIWDTMADWISSSLRKLISHITGDNYNNVPSSVYVHMEPHRSQLDMKNTIFAYDVSDMGQLVENILSWRIDEKMQKLEKKQKEKKQITPRITEIMHELNLKPVDMELEGFMFMENAPESFLYPLDTPTLDKVVEELAEIFLFNKPLNYVRMDVYDEVLSLPIETGLPFVFAIEKPMITLLDVAGQIQDLIPLSVRGNINVLDSSKVQYKVSFAAPFEQWEYISGVDKARVVVAPLAFDLKFINKDNEKNLNAKLSPSWQLNNADYLLQLTNTPYTAINNLREHRSANTRPIQLANRLKKTIDIRFLRLTTELDRACLEKSTLKDYLAISTTSSIAPSVCNYNIALQTKIDWTPKEVVLVTSVYAKDDVKPLTDSSSEQEDENETELEKLLIVDKKPNSKERRFQFLKQAKKATDISRVVDINLRTFAYEEVPVVDYVFTGAVGYNQKYTKLRGYVYYNRQTADENILFEGTINGAANLQPVTLENLKETVQSAPEDRYLANVEWKRQGEEEKALNLKLIVRQSDNLRKAIQTSKTVQECLDALENKGEEIESCKKAVKLVDTRDDFKWRVEYNEELVRQINQYKIFRNILATPLPVFRYEIRNDPKRGPKNRTVLEMEVKAPFNAKQMDLTLYTPEANIAYSMPKELTQTLPLFLQREQQPSCIVTKNKLTNFDDVTYNVNIGSCWHLMMATMKLTATIPIVMIQEDGQGDLAVGVITHTKKHIYLRARGNELQALLDSKSIASSFKDSTYYGHGVWIYSTPRNLMLFTQDKQFEIIFYGKTVNIRISDELRDKVTGLCSNYNPIIEPDCQMNTPEEFVASYAVPSMDCKGPALLNKQKANMALAMCSPRQLLSSNVISDEEAGRGPKNRNRTRIHHNVLNTYDQKLFLNVNYRTWYYEEDSSTICFTTVRIPQCLIFGSWPEDMEEKEYNFYCTVKDNAAMAIKDSIDEGVGPDLSNRPVSKTKIIPVPRRCSDPK